MMQWIIYREVKLLQKTLKQRQAESNQQDAKLYANMFPQPAKNLAVVTKVCFCFISFLLVFLI